MAVFSACAFKIMPAINRLIFSLQGISFSTSIINEIKSFQNKYVESTDAILLLNFKKSIIIQNNISFIDVNFKYANEKKNIINNLNFELQLGQSIGILGKSGSGKTTFLDLLIGLQKPTNGKISIDSIELDASKNNWHKNFTYVTQNTFIFEGTLLSNITLNKSSFIDYDYIYKILDVLQLKEFVDSQKDKLNLILGERGLGLSGGQAQRIGIARAIYNQSKIMIMDEPTSALDVDTEDFIFKNLHKISKATNVIVSHKKSALQSCSIIYKFTSDGNLQKI